MTSQPRKYGATRDETRKCTTNVYATKIKIDKPYHAEETPNVTRVTRETYLDVSMQKR
jgi:hypothetical protein